jgi:YaiO family outer membrane protein
MTKRDQPVLLIIILAMMMLVTPTFAQTLAPPKEPEKRYIEPDFIEVGINYYDLDSGFDDWKGAFVRGSWQQNEKNIWDAEILHQQRYGEWGTYYVAGVTHIFNDDWYGSLHIGTSSAFFFSKLRVDAFINRKVLPERNLVLTAGIGYDKAQQVNTDRSLYLGASYYFETPYILEGGVRFNRSSPGPENSTRYRVALTYGRAFERYIIGEIDWGTEAYQYIAEDVSILDFDSQVYALTWREWVKRDWGFALRGEIYQSDNYDRLGIEASVFKHF